MVAEHGTGVAPGHGEPGRCCTAACAGLASLEEVAEEDGIDLILGIGLERLPEPVDVTLDIADDQGGSGHRLQDTFARLLNRRRQPAACARSAPLRG